MPRPRYVAAIFTVCLAVMLVTMAWVSRSALRLERAELDSRRRAALEENIRLAMWRMDSWLASLIARENGRAHSSYESFYPPDRAYSQSFSEARRGQVLVPSPLLADTSPEILLHFQIGPKNELTSPQVPDPNQRPAALRDYTTAERIEIAAGRLASLRGRVTHAQLAAAIGEQPLQALDPTSTPALANRAPQTGVGGMQRLSSQLEGLFRSRRASQIASDQNLLGNTIQMQTAANVAVMSAVWVGDMLMLARRVEAAGEVRLQGCWIDWPALKKTLLSEIVDLLPEAELVPASEGGADDESRVLASLPVRLLPRDLPPGFVGRSSPMGVTLVIAWSAVVLAGVAVAILLFGTVALSERRAAFVSAVTHELRTPLTTFRLYTEMLDQDAVPDEDKRRQYIHTLRNESDRLAHLVENVLSFARLERGSAAVRERVTVRSLLDRAVERFGVRAAEAEMKLSVSIDPAVQDTQVSVDTASVERILFNLLENACRYASSASEKTIELSVVADGGGVSIRVRDHGPGIAPGEASRMFRPFARSRGGSAKAASGVGLGLALSRRLARSMGGDLRLDPRVSDGACFVFRLPLR